MNWLTAIFAVTCGLCAAGAMAQEQVREAEASFVFNGEQIQITRDGAQAAQFATVFATQDSACGTPCIAPLQVAPGVASLDELQVLAFLVDVVAADQGLMLDARMPTDRARGFIPGSVNLPHATLGAGDAYRVDILRALGARDLDGVFNFSDARSLLVYDTGPGSDDAGDLVRQLLASGYPADKIKYYRGGMQVWSVLGFSVNEGQS